jgi:hypothetical protein
VVVVGQSRRNRTERTGDPPAVTPYAHLHRQTVRTRFTVSQHGARLGVFDLGPWLALAAAAVLIAAAWTASVRARPTRRPRRAR